MTAASEVGRDVAADALAILEALVQQPAPADVERVKAAVTIPPEAFAAAEAYLFSRDYVRGISTQRIVTRQGIRFLESVRSLQPLNRTLLPVDILRQRLQDLLDNMRQDLALLKDYEDALRYEDDPLRRARYRQAEAQLQESVRRYQAQYDVLQPQLAGRTPEEDMQILALLGEIREMLRALPAGIRGDISAARDSIVARYEAGERRIIADLSERLNAAQLATVQTVLDALEQYRVSDEEVRSLLAAAQATVAALAQKGIAVPEQEAAARIWEAPTFGVMHKLKATLPLIPLLLNYEVEFELASKVNLEAAWNGLVRKLRGN